MPASTLTPPARPIDKRYMPAVGGIDLVQALNYINISESSLDFCYDYYTSARLAYKSGARPELERVATRVTANCATVEEKVDALNTFVAKDVAWAGFFEKRTGKRLTTNLALSEEKLIEQKAGWCNEQARVLCGLTQVVGIPSRIVFASNKAVTYGHCITEVLLPSGWLMLDQSFGYAFKMRGEPVRAYDVFNDPDKRAYFEPIYKKMCDSLKKELGEELLARDFAMSMAPNPLDGFGAIGFHNHFVI